jgi:hypothetical protein
VCRGRSAVSLRGSLRTPTERQVTAAVLVTIVLAGGLLRLSGANWDAGQHLHPDERYVSLVADNIRWPGSVGEYFNVKTSQLSPYNTETGRSYVYGTLPLFATKLVAGVLGKDDYAHLNIVGRRLSALVDTASILLVFLLGRLLLEELGGRGARAGALLAAALYAFTVTVIQAAHFFTMESWLVFFTLLTFFFAVRSVRSRPSYALTGASLGLTAACKASGALVTIPVLIGLLGETVLAAKRGRTRDALLRLGAAALTIVAAGYVAFRAVSPYAFADSNWLDVSINPAFRDALQSQQDAINGTFLYPPAYQWLLSPRLWDPLKNLVVWQLGVQLGIAAFIGVAVVILDVVRRRHGEAAFIALTLRLMLLSFVLTVFFYFGSKFAHTGRYLLPLVPFAVLAAAYGVVSLLHRRAVVLAVAGGVLVVATGLYALAYRHVYTTPSTRIAASEWITQHVPPGTTIAIEHWDDSLPVGAAARRYKGEVLPVFDADDATKLSKLYNGLAASKYYVLSSPRAWRTVGRLPKRFPIMSRFYERLFAGGLGFVRVARFTSEPQLLGVQLHDTSAEEAFWVYDHPPVMIYRKRQALDWAAFRRRLCEPAPAPPGCL